jgi:hypothetical protein
LTIGHARVEERRPHRHLGLEAMADRLDAALFSLSGES